jgi:phosphatidylglycerophosphatase A
MLNYIYHIIATVGFSGYFRFAPGTVGTGVAGLVIFLLRPSDLTLLLVIPLLFIIGVLASHSTEKILGKDSGHIVIDEFCGYFISVLFVPKSIGYLIAAFFIFRLFDIVKPPPVRNAENYFSGGFGIMFDDVLAAIYTNLCLQAWKFIFF